MHEIDTSTTRAFPFHKSPLKFGGTGNLKVKRASKFLKNLPALPTIEEEDEVDEEVSYKSNVRPRSALKNGEPSRLRRAMKAHMSQLNEDEDDEMAEWDEEATLVALLQDEYVSFLMSVVLICSAEILPRSSSFFQLRLGG